MAPHASAARSTPAARCGLRRCGCASRRPHGSVLRTLLRCYPGVSSPGLVGPAGVEPASAGFLCSRAQTVRPMKCPSVRAAKRLSALSHNRRRFSPSQGGTDNRHVDQTHRGGKGWGRPSEPFSAADAKHLPARGHHARSKGMTSTFPQSTGSGRRRVSSHAVSWGSSSSGVFRRTTA